MKIVHSRDALSSLVTEARQAGKIIGFVPTMGALHAGHISLVEKAAEMTNYVVVSIFVNPTQFNDPKDLQNYPRIPEKDISLLSAHKVDCVFMPDTAVVYPEPDTRVFQFEGLDETMEGKHRPGHFNGVAQVVSRLFELVRPDLAFFGEKDFQQLAIIRKMVGLLKLPVKIVPCPIIREENGLAMSSRNMLLSPEEREHASVISRTLRESKEMSGKMSIDDLKKWAIDKMQSDPLLQVEYFEIADASQLKPVLSWSEPTEKYAFTAVRIGKVRLIDNMKL